MSLADLFYIMCDAHAIIHFSLLAFLKKRQIENLVSQRPLSTFQIGAQSQ